MTVVDQCGGGLRINVDHGLSLCDHPLAPLIFPTLNVALVEPGGHETGCDSISKHERIHPPTS